MSSRRQRGIPLGGRYRQVSLYLFSLHLLFVWLPDGLPGVIVAFSRRTKIKICMSTVISRPHVHDDVIKRNIFRVTGPLCGKFTGHWWIPRTQRPVTWNFDVFFDLRMKKWLSKQSRRQWLETSSRSLWRHCNDLDIWIILCIIILGKFYIIVGHCSAWILSIHTLTYKSLREFVNAR